MKKNHLKYFINAFELLEIPLVMLFCLFVATSITVLLGVAACATWVYFHG